MTSTKKSEIVMPNGGRICQRAVAGGHLWIGALHLPDDFTPTEGVAYLAVQREGRLLLLRREVSEPLSPQHQVENIGGLLQAPIWNKTMDSDALCVRFIEAFPGENVWGVYGASHYAPPEGSPSHLWADISPRGEIKPIEAPFDAQGYAVGQMLSTQPVWPRRNGDLYTIPQIQSGYRQDQYDYHQLLLKAARDPEVMEELPSFVRQNPKFWSMSTSVDPLFTQYLDHLDREGMVQIDAPHSAAEVARKEAMSAAIMKALMDIDDTPRARPRP